MWCALIDQNDENRRLGYANLGSRVTGMGYYVVTLRRDVAGPLDQRQVQFEIVPFRDRHSQAAYALKVPYEHRGALFDLPEFTTVPPTLEQQPPPEGHTYQSQVHRILRTQRPGDYLPHAIPRSPVGPDRRDETLRLNFREPTVRAFTLGDTEAVERSLASRNNQPSRDEGAGQTAERPASNTLRPKRKIDL